MLGSVSQKLTTFDILDGSGHMEIFLLKFPFNQVVSDNFVGNTPFCPLPAVLSDAFIKHPVPKTSIGKSDILFSDSLLSILSRLQCLP